MKDTRKLTQLDYNQLKLGWFGHEIMFFDFQTSIEWYKFKFGKTHKWCLLSLDQGNK